MTETAERRATCRSRIYDQVEGLSRTAEPWQFLAAAHTFAILELADAIGALTGPAGSLIVRAEPLIEAAIAAGEEAALQQPGSGAE